MAELKRNFLKARMNKDLDERLVPKGEYRDALNIEIASSEGSEVGSVQTLKGNVRWTENSSVFRKSKNAQTVGIYNDKEKNNIYNFVCSALDFTPTEINTSFGVRTLLLGPKSDLIEQISPHKTNKDLTAVRPVLHDVYEVRTRPSNTSDTSKNTITKIKGSLYTLDTNYTNSLGNVSHIRPGMRVQAIDLQGNDVYGPDNEIIVKSITQTGDGITGPIEFNITTTNVYGATVFLWTSSMKDQGVYLKFTAPRVLKFRKGDSKEAEANVTNTPTSFTPKNSYINAINVIDNYLFWTDGRNEPKKINIERSIRGTKNLSEGLINVPHTILTIEKAGKFYKAGFLEESHITVLKPNPDTSLVAKAINKAASTTANIPIYSKPGGSDQPFGYWNFVSDAGVLLNINTNIYIQPQTVLTEPWPVGTIIVLSGFSTSFQISIEVQSIHGDNPGPEGGYYTVKRISEYPEGYDGSAINEPWMAQVKSKEDFYSSDFISFSYRYVYTDRETSCLAPFSSAVFLPGDYSYSPKDGYNLGMQSTAEEIRLSNFVLPHTPKDVIAIDLVFKSEKSDNVYIYKTIEKVTNVYTSNALLQPYNNLIASSAFGNTFEATEDVITEKLFGFTVPSDQLTRNFDAVPKKAIAQEIQANRLMYANYTQDYDLIDTYGNKITPSVSTNVVSSSAGFQSSFNSNDTLRAAYGTHYSGVEITDTDTPIFVHNARNYKCKHQVQNMYTTQTIKMGVENDPGNNFTPGNRYSIYVVPKDGNYKIKAYAEVNAYHKYGASDDYTYRPRKIRLAVLPNQPTTHVSWSNVQDVPQGVAENNGTVDPDGSAIQDTSLYWVGAQSNTIDSFTDNTYIYYEYNGGKFTMSSSEPALHSSWYSFQSMQNNNEPYESQNGPDGSSYFVQSNPGTATSNGYRILEIPETEVYLQEGQVIALHVQSPEVSSYLSVQDITVKNTVFEVTEAPTETFDLPSLKGQKSIKSERNYNVGIVYRDALGRESSVLIGKDEDFTCEKDKSNKQNSLTFCPKNNYPSWATTYKYFIKETTTKYNNLVLEAAFASTEGDYMYLVFNSVDKDKVKTGDYLVAKKQHNTNVAINDTTAKYRIVSIIGEASADETDGGVNINVQGNTVPASIIADTSQLDGKFFVKVARTDIDGEGTVLGVLNDGVITSISSNNGAVFETEPETTLDLDLYYEIGDAYPIMLDAKNASKHIKTGSYVTAHSVAAINGILSSTNYSNPKVVKVQGSITKGLLQRTNKDADYYCKVTLDTPLDLNYIVNDTYDYRIRFSVGKNFYTEAYLGKTASIGDTVLYLKPEVHYTDYDPLNLRTAVPWYNCISFGNGVESDTIRDDFNATELHKYIASGKKSGVKASTPISNYSEYVKPSNIIFSEIYNENRSLNRYNEFLMSKNIIKQINSDYGSIQKLFSRNNDLLTLCEKKCLKVLSQKDALFNADGKQQLLSTDKVLGQAIPFAGDYGISKNPESFAADEYRCYFTDANRGAVIRLSNDGITPISKVGMNDWFRDHLVNSEAIIGSFDSDKEEYTVSLHEVTQKNVSKLVNSLSFNEDIDGWTSFKSYIQEAGLTLNNKYYTFNKGEIWRHHANDKRYNVFYGNIYNSSITAIFNDEPSVVKTFRYLDYEGTQAKVVKNTEDLEYYNLEDKEGWCVEYLNTNLQESIPTYFIDKEGKWFSYVKGVSTKHTNLIDGGTSEDSNLDTKEFTVQGLGSLNSNVILIGGTLPSQGFDLNITADIIPASGAASLAGGSSSTSSGSSGGSSSGGGGY